MNSALKLLSIAIALACPSLAIAGNYSFSRVFTGYAAPGVAINDGGLVALAYQNDSIPGDWRLITTNGVTSTTVAGAYAQSNLTISEYDYDQAFSLNSSGFVAFRGYSYGKYGVLACDGITTYEIAADTSNGGSFQSIAGASAINDSGVVAFTASQSGSSFQVFAGSGGASAALVNVPGACSPALNNAGTVAYYNSTTSTIGIQKGSQALSLPGTPVAACMPDINNLGCVAFSAIVDGTQDVVIGDGVSPTKYIDASLYKGGLTMGLAFDGAACDCAINDNGLVVFGATVTSDYKISGLFTGSDPIADKVIETGDLLDGATVEALCFSRNGLNNRGQIAFVAQFADGTQDVYVATPVPEPSTVVLLVVASIGLFGCAWRASAKRT